VQAEQWRFSVRNSSRKAAPQLLHGPEGLGHSGFQWSGFQPAAKNAPANKLGKMVKVPGYELREGTQKHKQLLQQREHAEDLRRSETAMNGRTKQHREGQFKLWG